MKKSVLWIVITLVVVAGLFAFQWREAAEEKKRLQAGIKKLERDLAMINKVRSTLPELSESIVKENALVDELHKRIPADPMVKPFMDNLSEQMKAAGVEVAEYDFTTVKRDFYDEIQLKITLKQEISGLKPFGECISESERLVALKEFVPGPPAIIHLHIFSHSLTFNKPSIKPCPESDIHTGGWSPFNIFLDKYRKMLRTLCDERKNEEALLLEVRKYENIREYRIKLETIVSALSANNRKKGKRKILLCTSQKRPSQFL